MPDLSTNKNRRVLIIDDNRAIHEDFRKILSPAAAADLDAAEAAIFGEAAGRPGQIQFQVESAHQGREGLLLAQQAVAAGRPYALAFVDVRMPPGWDGLETTRKLWEADPDLQIVLCSAYSDYSWGDMIAKLGHSDGLLVLKKPFDAVEALQLAHALTEKRWLRQESRQKMEELESRVAERTGELRQSNNALQASVAAQTRTVVQLQSKTAFFESLVNSSTDGILVVDPDRKTTLQNQRFADLFKTPPHIAAEADDEIRLKWALDMIKDPKRFLEKVLHLYAHPEESCHDEIELKNGTTLDRSSFPAVGGDGTCYGRVWTFRDVTERKRLEARLFQSQKMETVGKLAGGIAHEFNSILTAIIGQSEFMLSDLPPESPLTKNAVEIHRAADRAAKLTRQLLAYGRKQVLQPAIINLNLLLAEMESTLKHLMGRDVDVRIVPAAALKTVKMDPGQLEQVIVNLAMNAAAAMPNGGKLTLETASVTLDRDYAGQFPDLKPGEYVMLAVTDTGTGISPEVKKHLFEPFFTTKDVGEGPGLGLATCYGILKQSGGHINVYSELSRGATLKVYLPQFEATPKGQEPRPEAAPFPRGTETILLVEDDPALREMAATLLARLGYTVRQAADGLEALNLKHQRGVGHVDLVFTDVVMPHMSGRELADRFRLLYPQTRILFTSAYTENAIVHQGVLSPGITFLQKPFSPGALAAKVREILDQPAA